MRSLIFTLIALALSAEVAHAEWRNGLAGCEVFESKRLQSTQVMLPAGPAIPRADATGYMSQYLPYPQRPEAGALNLTVYDCPSNKTAFGIATDLRRRLRADNWQLIYGCDMQACGRPGGWLKSLPELRSAANADAQNYSLAMKTSVQGSRWLALYNADLDERPRVVAYELMADYRLAAKPGLDYSRVHSLYDQGHSPVSQLHFESGSAKPAAGYQLPQEFDPSYRWVVVGHSDNEGGEALNGPLSWRRALAVADLLKASGIPNSSIELFAVASLIPAVQGQDSAARQTNRRVDIFQLPINPPSASASSGTARTYAETKTGM